MRRLLRKQPERRIIQQGGLPWWVYVIGVLGALCCLVTGIYSMLAFLALLMLMGFLVLPSVTAIIAAILTANDCKMPQFELLTLTMVSNRELVMSYFWAAYYRLRYIILVVALLMPIGTLLAVGFAAGANIYERLLVSPDLEGPPPSDLYDLNDVALRALFAFVGLWGMSLAGLALGVMIGLGWRNVVASAITAPLVIAGVIAVLLLLLANASVAVAGPLIGLGPFVLAVGFLMAATQLVRELS